MALFLSTYVNKIDKKGRVSIPAPFRLAVAQESFHGVVLFRSYKLQALEGFPMSRMVSLSESMDGLEVFSDVHEDLASTIFADAHQLAFDSEGRIVLPEALIAHTELKESVALVGRGRTFQLWHPEIFKHHQKQARARVQKSGITLKLKGNGGEQSNGAG